MNDDNEINRQHFCCFELGFEAIMESDMTTLLVLGAFRQPFSGIMPSHLPSIRNMNIIRKGKYVVCISETFAA